MLSLRSGDATSNVRMNETSYFELLKGVFDEPKLADHHECIYNMHETGAPLEPRPPKFVAQKGVKKIQTVLLVKRNKLLSLVVAMQRKVITCLSIVKITSTCTIISINTSLLGEYRK